MKKQGFTLIELMVVIVIMGILAAVAVPKLFGMIAKSKASEVGPAAGTYVHLQDSYYAEMNAVGDKSQIGYKEPASTVFTYGVTVASDVATFTAVNSETALNDCQQNTGSWNVASQAGSSGLEHEATVTGTGCGVLTPSFTSIGAGT